MVYFLVVEKWRLTPDPAGYFERLMALFLAADNLLVAVVGNPLVAVDDNLLVAVVGHSFEAVVDNSFEAVVDNALVAADNSLVAADKWRLTTEAAVLHGRRIDHLALGG